MDKVNRANLWTSIYITNRINLVKLLEYIQGKVVKRKTRLDSSNVIIKFTIQTYILWSTRLVCTHKNVQKSTRYVVKAK